MIEIEDLHATLAGQEVLRGISFRVDKGEFFALIGKSGSGKSVLLKHVAGLMAPLQGRILIDGEVLNGVGLRQLERIRSRFGFVFQSGALFDSMTVYENLAFPLREKLGMEETEIEKRIEESLEQVGLAGVAAKYPAELSGGMVKRTSLARALITNPEIIFFDEPTTGLDPIIAKSIVGLFSTFHKRLNLTGIIVTHQVDEILPIVQKVGMVHEGKIVLAEVDNGRIRSNNEIIRQFVAGKIDGPINYA